jgi:hypothetical protein
MAACPGSSLRGIGWGRFVMPESKPYPITPQPGVVKTETEQTAEGRWIDSEKIRFNRGRAQKFGGWEKKTTSPVSGAPRAMLAWRNNVGTEFIGVGTYRKLYFFNRDFEVEDITPLRAEGTLGNNPFAMTTGSPIVTVTHTAHGVRAGDTVIFDGASAAHGLTIDGSYLVATRIDANSYTIVASGNASGTGSGGGASVTYEYEVSIGVEQPASGFGYGVGGYGLSTYGTAREESSIVIEPRVWSLDHLGRDLISSFNGGSVYEWNPDEAPTVRAAKIANAPVDVRSIFVTDERIIVALCDDMTMTAGTRKLAAGSQLMRGAKFGGGLNMVWSDYALYLMQFTGSQFVYDTRMISDNCGLIAPGAMVVANGVAYWMGNNTFFQSSGGPAQPIPNVQDIRDYVFNNLRTTHGFLCAAVFIPKFNEVIWFYVPTGSDEPGLYVLYSINDQCWAVGTLSRVSGAHFARGETRPYMASPEGHIYLHEVGYNDDGAAMTARLELAPYSVGNGSQSIEIDGIEPDFQDQVGDVSLTIEMRDRLRGDVIDTQEKVIEPDTELSDFRVGGRYVGMVIESAELDGYFRMGTMQALGKATWRRR